MVAWRAVNLILSTISCIFGAIGWGLFIVGYALRLNDRTYDVREVYACTRGNGSSLLNYAPEERQLWHFANFEFFSWWAVLATGPVLILALVITQLVVSFAHRVTTASVCLFIINFLAIFYFAVSGSILREISMQFYCTGAGHTRYVSQYYFVPLEFAGVLISVIFLGFGMFFQFLLSLCRYKRDTDYEVGCGWGICFESPKSKPV